MIRTRFKSGFLSRALVDYPNRIECPRIADEGQQVRHDCNQRLAPVSRGEVGSHVPSQLRLAAAEGCQHGQGEQLPGLQIKPGAGEEVTKAVGGQVALDVQLILR